jgi:enamine deaminase RidA (YjgF/YER057c/UK114 family)
LFDGVPYDYSAGAGGLVFVAGACPLDSDGNVVDADLGAQAERALDNLAAALDREGCGLDDVVKTTVYVASDDRADLVKAWRTVEQRFAPSRPPSTLLGVTALGWPGQLFEIEAVAKRRSTG